MCIWHILDYTNSTWWTMHTVKVLYNINVSNHVLYIHTRGNIPVLPYTWKNDHVYLITSFLPTTESDTLSMSVDIQKLANLLCSTLFVSRIKLLHFLPSHSPGGSTTISWQGCQMVFWIQPHNSQTCKCISLQKQYLILLLYSSCHHLAVYRQWLYLQCSVV